MSNSIESDPLLSPGFLPTLRMALTCWQLAQLGLARTYPTRYNVTMLYELQQTDNFAKWFKRLKDKGIKTRLIARFAIIENGNLGDHKQLAENLYELRMTFGGGIRLYYTVDCGRIILLLAGGNKGTQSSDIKRAEAILKDLG